MFSRLHGESKWSQRDTIQSATIVSGRKCFLDAFSKPWTFGERTSISWISPRPRGPRPYRPRGQPPDGWQYHPNLASLRSLHFLLGFYNSDLSVWQIPPSWLNSGALIPGYNTPRTIRELHAISAFVVLIAYKIWFSGIVNGFNEIKC